MEIPGLSLAASLPTSAASEAKKEARAEGMSHFRIIRYLYQSGDKLSMGTLSLSTAAHLYHRVFQACHITDFDPYLIAMTCLYLASKVEEEHKRLRDVINVCHRTLHMDKPPLDIGSTYWSLRESVVQCELLVMRLLKFEVVVDHPHKYLLHYLVSLSKWLPPGTARNVPYCQTAWTMLRDSYHGNTCTRYPANWVAVAVLYLAFQCHGIAVPCNDQAEYRWWEAFVEDLDIKDVRKIVHELIDTYETETVVT